MLQIARTNQFKRDYKLSKKRGRNVSELLDVVDKLSKHQKLEAKYKSHNLRGSFKNCFECHIEPDWLLIYQIDGNELTLIRCGTHLDLFD